MNTKDSRLSYAKNVATSFLVALVLTAICSTLVMSYVPLNRNRDKNRGFLYRIYLDVAETQPTVEAAVSTLSELPYDKISNLQFWFYSERNGIVGDKEGMPSDLVDYIKHLDKATPVSFYGLVAGPFGQFYVILKSQKFDGYLVVLEPKTGPLYAIRQRTSEIAAGIVMATMFLSFFVIFTIIQRQAAQFNLLLDLLASGGKGNVVKKTLLDRLISVRRGFKAVADRTETMVSSLKNAEAMRSSLVAQIAHDLRTPLTSMRTSAETLATGENLDAQSLSTLTSIILDDVQFLSRLTENLLGLADLERETVESEPIDLRGLAGGLFQKYKNSQTFQDRKIEWRYEIDNGEDFYVYANETQMRRVIINLIDNAIDFTKSTITIGMKKESGFVLLFVADDGPGLSEQARQHYGKRTDARFATTFHHDKRRTSIGLGSMVVVETVKSFGGEIDLTNRNGVGLCVQIRLKTAVANAS